MDRPEQPAEGTATGQATSFPSRPAVVIFQLGEGSSDNYLIDLPTLTVTNSNFTRLNPPSAPHSETQEDPSSTDPTIRPVQPASTPASTSASTSTLASSTNASEPTSTSSIQTSSSSTSPAEASENQQAASTDSAPQRNMSVSVSYVYSHTPPDNGRETRREGTIMLNVPNVPFNRTEGQMNSMIELAASIALGAVAAFTQRRRPEISRASFDKFSLVDKSLLVDDTCPICYDAYLPLPVPLKKEEKVEVKQVETIDGDVADKAKNQFGKRARDDDDLSENGDEEHGEDGTSSPRKSRKLRANQSVDSTGDGSLSGPISPVTQAPLNNSIPQPQASSSGTSNSPFDTLHHNRLREQLRAFTRANGSTTQDKDQEESNLENGEYTHIPVELPCGHIFGRSCSYTWLKTKSTCPLCRTEVHSDISDQNPPQTINLPDIVSFMSASSSRQRPLVIVLDRNTNTLSTRVGQQDTSNSTGDNVGPAPPSSSSYNDTSSATGSTIDDETAFENILPLTGFHDDSLNPVGIPLSADASVSPVRMQRDRTSLEALNRSFSPRNTDGLFPIGVASTRTRQGVQTFNLDNESSTMGFATEARRMLERRLLLPGRDRFLGFNEHGQAVTLPYSRGAPNGIVSTSTEAEIATSARQTDETTQTDDTPAPVLGVDEQNDGQ